MQEINIHKWISLKYETDNHIHGQKRILRRSMNKMSPNMPGNISEQILSWKKKLRKIQVAIYYSNNSLEICYGLKKYMQLIFFHSYQTFSNGLNDL
jgi:hypothetical protein